MFSRRLPYGIGPIRDFFLQTGLDMRLVVVVCVTDANCDEVNPIPHREFPVERQRIEEPVVFSSIGRPGGVVDRV